MIVYLTLTVQVNPGKDFTSAHLSTALARAGSCKASPAKNAKQTLHTNDFGTNRRKK